MVFFFTMKFTDSLRGREDFRNIYKKGSSLADPLLVLYKIPNGLTMNRLGISVSRKVGNSVVRHRITRLIREIYRLNEERLKIGYDLCFIARAGAKGQDYKTMEKSVLGLLRRQGIILNRREKDIN